MLEPFRRALLGIPFLYQKVPDVVMFLRMMV